MDKLFFIIPLLLTIIIAKCADKRNSKILLLITILIPSIIAGFRGINVGIDTPSYYEAFITNFPYSWQFEEEGFRTIVNLLMELLTSPTYIMFIFALITNALIILRLWDYRKECNFSFMIFIYVITFFIDSMNIMRQFLSIAVIFYSTRLLERKKFLSFIIIILLLTTIHKTSLLGLALVIIYLWKDLTPKRKVQLFIPISTVTIIAFVYILKYESSHILNYFSSSNTISNINITYLYRIFAFLLTVHLNKSNKKIVLSPSLKNSNDNYINIDKKKYGIITIIYLFGLILGSMGMFFFVMARLGYYYLIFELIYWGYLTKNNKNNATNKILIAVYALYVFVLEIIKNGSGIFPYYMEII